MTPLAVGMTQMPGSRQGNTYTTLTANVQKELPADRSYAVTELRISFGNTAITTQTLRLSAEGQEWFGQSGVPVRMLHTAHSAELMTPAAYATIVFRPSRPILWQPAFPLRLLSASALEIIVLADEIGV